MFKWILCVILLFSYSQLSAETIVLDKTNHFKYDKDVTRYNIDEAIYNLTVLRNNNAGDIYLVIDTNGGSVDAANKMLVAMKYLKIKVIAVKAISAGDLILQLQDGPRIGTINTVVMQHPSMFMLMGIPPYDLLLHKPL